MDNRNAKQKIIVPVLCVLISIGLWFYITNTENPIRTEEITRIPVEIVNTEKLEDAKLALAPTQNLFVTLKIEGIYRDIKNVTRDDFKLKVDLSDYALKKGSYKVPVEVVDYPGKVTIKNGGVVTVTINIEDYKEKDVPVTSNIQLDMENDHYALDPEFNPGSVTVSGAESIVNKVEKVRAEGREESVSEDIEKTYPITAVDEDGTIITGVNLSQNTVKAVIKVNNGKTVPIKVNTTGGLQDGFRLNGIELDHNYVDIVGPKAIIDNISEISTTSLDLSTITGSTSINLTLALPQGIKSNITNNIVTAKVNVEKVITKKLTIPFEFKGIASGFKAVGKTDKVEVTVSGYASELAKITSENLKAIINLTENSQEGSHTLQPSVTLVDAGDSIKIDNIQSVVFDIEKQ